MIDPQKYAIAAPYLSLILLYTGVLAYSQRRQWRPALIRGILRGLVIIGALGVVFSFYLFVSSGNATYVHVLFAWLLLEFGSVQIGQWLKEDG